MEMKTQHTVGLDLSHSRSPGFRTKALVKGLVIVFVFSLQMCNQSLGRSVSFGL